MYDNVDIVYMSKVESNDAKNVYADDQQPTPNDVKNINTILTSIKRARVSSLSHKNKIKLYDNLLILDTGAEVSIFKNRELLKNIREVENGVIIDGVNDSERGVYVSMMGETELGVEAYYSEQCTGNILSFGG